MIEFSYQTDFELKEEKVYVDWLAQVADSNDAVVESLGYVFCDDEFVFSMNVEHLNHDTYTDIITFDYGSESVLEGEIYISVDRVRDNASQFGIEFHIELKRVMVHGLLHMLGYGDHTPEEKEVMRSLEDKFIGLFHVKH